MYNIINILEKARAPISSPVELRTKAVRRFYIFQIVLSVNQKIMPLQVKLINVSSMAIAHFMLKDTYS